MSYSITAVLDKVTCTNFVVFGKKKDQFGRISWSQIERNNNKYLEIQPEVFKRDDQADFANNNKLI